MSDNIKTILYATDLGEHTRPAFRMAVNLAKTYNAKILFMYVIEPLSAAQISAVSVYFPTDSLAEVSNRSIEDIREKVHQRITDFCKEEMNGEEFPGGEPEPHILEGVPAATIIKTAEKMDVDLVVMGSHSHSTLDNLFIGSVANKVVNRCSKPVLLVPIKSD